jgi:hypothetical protein
MGAMIRPSIRLVLAPAALALALAGCGSTSKSSTSATTPATSPKTPSSTATSPVPPGPPAAVDELLPAEHPTQSEFPSADGRTPAQIARLVKSSAELGPATGVFTPGTRRFAFAITAKSGGFVYAPTALYLAATPHSPAKGPFLATADPMTVAPQYRSKQNTGPGGISAIYAANLPLPHSGTYTVLALTRTQGGLIGSPGEVAVAGSSPIPNVGQRPPAIATDTSGPISLLTTRLPPESMHSVSFKQALGKQPVALLFSTPQLCTSRVCGPVTDVLVSLQHEFAGKVTFIHQEVYVDNDPKKGLRPQLKAFGLRTEPWLFVVNRKGVITARFEGAFGVDEARAALNQALR